jgi:hypothetical protein
VADAALEELPEGIERDRHIELGARRHHVVVHRALMALLAALAVVALLNLLGQRASTTTAAGPTVVFDVRAPARLRGGLIYQTRFTVLARKPIKNLHLVLSPGWFEGLTLNTMEPAAAREGSRDGSVSLSYGTLDPGKRIVVWMEWQVNPTTLTHRSLEAYAYDGGAKLAHVHRTLTVLF